VAGLGQPTPADGNPPLEQELQRQRRNTMAMPGVRKLKAFERNNAQNWAVDAVSGGEGPGRILQSRADMSRRQIDLLDIPQEEKDALLEYGRTYLKAEDYARDVRVKSTKFDNPDYQLSGGTNYREFTISRPPEAAYRGAKKLG